MLPLPPKLDINLAPVTGRLRNCLSRKRTMTDLTAKPLRCAVYTRKSTEHNLDLAFTSLDAQREACEAYIRSQAGEGLAACARAL